MKAFNFIFTKKNNSLDGKHQHIAQTFAKHIEMNGGITYNCPDTKISFLLEQFLPIYLKGQQARVLNVFSRMHPNDKKLCTQVIKKYAPEFFEQHKLLLEITSYVI